MPLKLELTGDDLAEAMAEPLIVMREIAECLASDGKSFSAQTLASAHGKLFAVQSMLLSAKITQTEDDEGVDLAELQRELPAF